MTWHWDIDFFGGLTLRRDERVVRRFRTQKTAALLAYMAYFRGPHTREEIIEAIWPEVPPRTGRNNLSLALASLRRQLEDDENEVGPLIVANHTFVELAASHYQSDVFHFETHIKAGQWAQAIALYRGPFLAGMYEDWIPPEESRLEELYLQAINVQLEELERRGDHSGALALAYQGARLAPHSESLRQCLAELQKRTAAVPHTPFTSKPSLEAGLCLPTRGTRFFGRSNELSQLTSYNREGAQLITLNGPGGVGKTRLAEEWVHTQSQSCSKSVFWVALSRIESAIHLWDALLDTVLTSKAGIREPEKFLVAELQKHPRPILILDNFEQLVDTGAPVVERLMAALPRLLIVVTSRRLLGLMGEQEIALQPLPTPPQGEIEVRQALQWESVALFCDRAQKSRPDFAVTRRNAAQVAALCHYLEGLPLALELSAARSNVLSPAQMLLRFNRRLDLGQKPPRSRDFAARHASLRATLSVSFQLLSPPAQMFLTRLSVFAAGWTLPAAQQVTGMTEAELLLKELLAASLVRTDQDGRFSWLETIREFATEALSPKKSLEFSKRHADYFLHLANHFNQHGTEQWSEEHLKAARAERDNWRAAMDWLLRHDPEQALRLGSQLWPFWLQQDRFGEGREALLNALDKAPLSDSATRASASVGLARLCVEVGDFEVGRTWAAQALQWLRENGDQNSVAYALSILGLLAMNQNDHIAIDYLEEASTLARRGGNKTLLQVVVWRLALIHSGLGNFEVGRILSEENLQLAIEDGNKVRKAFALQAVGISCWAAGNLQRAASALETTRHDIALISNQLDLSRALWGLLNVRRELGDLDAARTLLSEYVTLGRSLENSYAMVYLYESAVALAMAVHAPEQTARLAGATQELRDRLQVPLLPVSERYLGPAIQQAKETLGTQPFEQFFEEGRTLTESQVLSLSLQL